MIVSKAQKQPKLNRVVVAAPKASPAKSPIVAASEPHASASQRQIRELAFENFKSVAANPATTSRTGSAPNVRFWRSKPSVRFRHSKRRDFQPLVFRLKGRMGKLCVAQNASISNAL
jgi:hypothetical protein